MNEIKKLFEQVIDKKGFIKRLAMIYGRTEDSIRTNWMSNYNIPEKNIKSIHHILVETLEDQIIKTKNTINEN